MKDLVNNLYTKRSFLVYKKDGKYQKKGEQNIKAFMFCSKYMNERLIKKLIIFIIVIIILCIIGLVYLLNIKANNEVTENNVIAKEENTIENKEIINEEEGKIDAETFYTVSKCVQLYLDTIDRENSNYYQIEDDGTNKSIVDTEEVKNVVYNILSKRYIEKNKISVNNVWQNVPQINNKLLFVPLNMKEVYSGDINTYIMYGEAIDLDYKLINEFYVIIDMDNNNKTFAVEPLNGKYENIDNIKIDNSNNQHIEINEDNRIINETIDDRYIAMQFLNNFKRLMLSNADKSYAYFETDYAKRRFGNIETFKKYIEQNREEIIGLQCVKYLVNEEEGYKQYVIQDQYENYYIFDVKSVLNYTVKLDTYTITTENFSTTYANANNEKKVQMNIDKFFKMINRHDYKTSYNSLAKSFKNNYSLAEDKFEQIAKNKFFSHNKIEFVRFEEVGDNTFVYEIKLTDLTGKDETERKITIIMKLNDGENFEMSFDIS